MDRAEFLDWVKRHAELFGLSPQQERTVQTWFRWFAERGVVAAQLMAASQALLDEPPQKISQHPSALFRLVRANRAKSEAEFHCYVCDFDRRCRPTGVVKVPAWSAWRDGRVTTAEAMQVTCACPDGQRVRETCADWDTLAEYEREYPGWRNAMWRFKVWVAGEAGNEFAAACLRENAMPYGIAGAYGTGPADGDAWEGA